MKLDDEQLAALYREATARKESGDGCLSRDLLLRAGSDDLSDADRERVASHIAGCSDCAREYRIARSVHPFASDAVKELRPRRTADAWAVAAAAMFVIALPLLIWLTVQRGRDRAMIASLQRQIAATPVVDTRVPPRDETPELRARVAELSRPRVGVPIVDLDADAIRGTGDGVTTIVVPSGADACTLILHAPGEIGSGEVELVDAAGKVSWSEAVHVKDASITISMQRATTPAGRYTIRIRSSSGTHNFPFRVDYR